MTTEMRSRFLRSLPLLLVTFCVLVPGMLTAQVTWKEIRNPVGPYEKITWPPYPTADGGLLMCIPNSGAVVYFSHDDGQDWTIIQLQGTSPYIWPNLCSSHQSSLPFVLAGWSGFFLVDPEKLTIQRLVNFDSTVVTCAATSDDGQSIAVLANSESVAGLLFVSKDGGRRWERVHVPDVEFSPLLETVAFCNDTLLIASYPRILWNLPPGETTLRQSPCDVPEGDSYPWLLGDGLLLMQYDSSIIRSNDQGCTWFDTRTGLPLGPVSLITCARSRDGTVYALINDGDQHHRLYRSADQGRTWNMLDRNGDPRITRFLLTPAGEVIWQFGTLSFARSSGLALSVSVHDIPDAGIDAGIYPHPLPFGERCTLWVNGRPHARWTMRILDLRGTVCASRNLQADAAGGIRAAFQPLLPPGTYFLEMRSGTHRRLLRLQLRP